MFITKRIIWFPIVAFFLSFLTELLAKYISFLNVIVAKVFFWVAVGLIAVLGGLEIAGQVHKFINEHFKTPRRNLEEFRERIKKEREKIEFFLDYEIDGKDVAELKRHYYHIDEYEFSKEALAPYLIEWYRHLESVHDLIKEDEKSEVVEDLKKQEQELNENIKKLKHEKEKRQASETQLTKSRREQFLEENKDRLFVYTEELSEEEQSWLVDEGFEKANQWDIEYKENKEMMIKRRHNENQSHAYLVSALHNHLRNELGWDEVEIYETKLPDLVFNANGFKWAIEVETGTQLKKNPKALREKVETNNKKYGKDAWFFVVTNRDLVSKYKKFAETVDRKGVLDKLEEIIFPEGRPESPM